jgi:tetratricopeptide (TPR) repeat protein
MPSSSKQSRSPERTAAPRQVAPTPVGAAAAASVAGQPPSILGRRDWLAAVVLAAATAVAFIPALGCRFINFDDPSYVLENGHVLDGLTFGGLGWAFTTFTDANWHPLTWLSLQLDATLWKTAEGGPDPRGFHLTNVLFHAANAALLFLALRSLTGAFWRSAAVALLFAVHPLRVESVAWVSERKDVLSLFFGLLTLWAYAGYARAPSRRRYLLVAAAFALSLLCKPMLVTLPCVLLVLDWWPLERLARGVWPLVREKLPLFAMVAASSAATVAAQSSLGAVLDTKALTPAVRLANSLVSYQAYLSKTFWPDPLAIFYPHPGFSGIGIEPPAVAGAVVLLGMVTALAVALRKRAPYLLAGWLWYLGTLVPVIGLIQVGTQGYADRYTYFPQIGILIAVCWGAAALVPGRPRALLAVATAAAVLLTGLTWRQLSVWRDAQTVWKHDLDVVLQSPVALNQYGAALQDDGRSTEATPYFDKALGMAPDFADACFNLALSMQIQEKLPEAVKLFGRLCKLEPDFSRGPVHLGEVLYKQGRLSEAAASYERALAIEPDSSATYSNLGRVEIARKDYARAADYYRKALQLRPKLAEAHNGLGSALVNLGKVDEGIAEFKEAIQYDPKSGQAHNNLAKALEDRGEFAGAIDHYEAGTRVSPKIAMIWFNLGRLRLRQAKPTDAAKLTDAVESLEKAVALERQTVPFHAALSDALLRLAGARAAAGQSEEAAAAARRARDEANAAGRPDIARQIEAGMEKFTHGKPTGPP